MAEQFRVAIIGCGRTGREEGRTGAGMAHYHAHGYQATGRCEIVALADISRENADAFAARHALTPAIHEDYRQMLAEVKPDIVSICTWPKLHAEMVLSGASGKY